MAQFTYIALGSDGRQTTGNLNAASREAAVLSLRQQNIRPLKVTEAKAKKNRFSIGKGKVKLRDLVIFTRELSTMVSAGVPLPRALDTLSSQTENKYFKEVITSVNHDIESGSPLAEALAKFPNVFSEVYINMVNAAEAGGILDEILKRLATQVEKDASIRKKFRGAMAYPVVILSVTIIAFFGIMLVIVPKIGKIFKDLGGPDAQLPIYTQIMLAISNFLVGHSIIHAVPLSQTMRHIPVLGGLIYGLLINAVFFILLGVIGFIFLLRYVRTEKGSYQFHYFLLKMPVFGAVISKIAVARFARTFSSLMGAGVSVLEALEVTGKAVGNKVIQKELVEAAAKVKNGQPLGKQLIEAKFFPPIVGQMMAVGEETGKIDQILVKVADFYEEEVDTVIDSLASIIEPMMIILLGALVGLIAASVMGPIANLSKQIG